jgi:hypothetical protein
MSSLMTKIRQRREASRQARIVDAALQRTQSSPAARDEILTLLNR